MSDEWKFIKKHDNVDKIDCTTPSIYPDEEGYEKQVLGECELLKKTYESKEETLYEDQVDYIENIDLLKIDGNIINQATYFAINKDISPSDVPIELIFNRTSTCKVMEMDIDDIKYKALLCYEKDLPKKMEIKWE